MLPSPSSPLMDEMLMMEPRCAGSITLKASRVATKAELTFTSKSLRKASGVMSTIGE